MEDPRRDDRAPWPRPRDPGGADPDATVILGEAEAGAAVAAAAAGAATSSVPAPIDPTSAPASRSAGTLPGGTFGSAPGGRAAAVNDAGGDDAPGRQVGRYLIRGRVGRGGMASVYRAHDPKIGRDVAIKFLHATLAEDAECHARFLREARAAGGLSHPNIAVVHDVDEIEGRPYMSMELVDGETLADVLDRRKTLPIREAATIALQIARALDFAHAHGVVHRDIKPGNILMPVGGRSVKVTDFGIAHLDDAITDASGQRTQVGAVLGTPQYMSPEQAKGEKLDGRSDIFSAGIVLYQMLGGERPFRADSMVALATKIATEPHAPLNALRPDVPASLRRVVDRCLAKAPDQRFTTGAELAEALAKVRRELGEAEQQQARPHIVPLRLKWALAMAAIVALVMGITATVITQRQYDAMVGQASDYGASLARFVARQTAESALNDDWETVDAKLEYLMGTRNFERIVMIDGRGIVRSSSRPALVGKPYTPEGRETIGSLAGGTAALRYHVDGAPVLGFEAPVTYQNQPLGRIALGIPEEPLTKAARLSKTLMAVLVLVTTLAAAAATWLLARRFGKPIELVGESLDEIAKGRFAHRIGETRKDEFGELYARFDAMAQALQQHARFTPPLDGGIASTFPPTGVSAPSPLGVTAPGTTDAPAPTPP